MPDADKNRALTTQQMKQFVRFAATSFENVRPPVSTIRQPQHVGRNDPCPCGSGKKFKLCCLRRQALRLPTPYVPPTPRGGTATVVQSEPTVKLAGVELSADQLRQAGVPAEFVHAFSKTGRFIIPSLRDRYDAETLRQWDEAVEEGRQQQGAADANAEHHQYHQADSPRSDDPAAGQ